MPGASEEEMLLRWVELNYSRTWPAASQGRSRPVEAADLVAALSPVADAFVALGISYRIGGSVTGRS